MLSWVNVGCMSVGSYANLYIYIYLCCFATCIIPGDGGSRLLSKFCNWIIFHCWTEHCRQVASSIPMQQLCLLLCGRQSYDKNIFCIYQSQHHIPEELNLQVPITNVPIF